MSKIWVIVKKISTLRDMVIHTGACRGMPNWKFLNIQQVLGIIYSYVLDLQAAGEVALEHNG